VLNREGGSGKVLMVDERGCGRKKGTGVFSGELPYWRPFQEKDSRPLLRTQRTSMSPMS